jgi:glycosyltransferase involved in cell wall biosynthesis
MNLGAVPEIVQEGVTGFTAGTAEELRSAVPKCFGLDRQTIHKHALQRYSAERMARAYAAVYERAAGA